MGFGGFIGKTSGGDSGGIDIAAVIASLPADYARDVAWQASGQTKLLSPKQLTVKVNSSGYIVSTQQEIDISQAANWDTASFTAAENRAGKDFYIYTCQPATGITPLFLLSANSTVPIGYEASNCRKIGGFHCLCAAVGIISGHTLSDYSAGDILPASIWDLIHRPVCQPEGMVYDANTNKWIDVYLASVSESQLVSIYNGVIADGTSTPAFHWYKGTDWLAKSKKNLLTQREFMSASLGSNQGTNIASESDPNTTGGHSDFAGRRMISNIGCEDMCGAQYQWGAEAGGPYHSSETYETAYDSNDTGVRGTAWKNSNRVVLGGIWVDNSRCGSRNSSWSSSPMMLSREIGFRGCAEPL